MPHPSTVHCAKTFTNELEMWAYASGLNAGIAYESHSGSNPSTVQTEYNSATKEYSAYIQSGYFNSDGYIVWNPDHPEDVEKV